MSGPLSSASPDVDTGGYGRRPGSRKSAWVKGGLGVGCVVVVLAVAAVRALPRSTV